MLLSSNLEINPESHFDLLIFFARLSLATYRLFSNVAICNIFFDKKKKKKNKKENRRHYTFLLPLSFFFCFVFFLFVLLFVSPFWRECTRNQVFKQIEGTKSLRLDFSSFFLDLYRIQQ